ncbi:M24 family metallopeptidase [Chloroflexota bacterium]
MAIEEVRKEIRFGQKMSDWQGRINMPEFREERFKKAQAALKQNGVAALLAAGSENKRYVSSCIAATHTGSGDSFAVIFAEGSMRDNCIVYEESECWRQDHEHVDWIKPENHRYTPVMWQRATGLDWLRDHAKDVANHIYQDLKDRKLEKEKLGVDNYLPFLKDALEEKGVKLVDAWEIMMNCRIIKTENEIECMKMAGAIADVAWAEIIEALRPGKTEEEIAAVGQSALRRLGSKDGRCTIRSGPNTAPNYLGRMPTDRIIQPGDLVFGDIVGGHFLGYRTCYYRTFKVGTKPTEQEKDWYKKCRDYLYNAVEVLRDGITSADVAAKWPKAIDAYGFEDEALASGNLLGHGQGLGQYEFPVITRQNSLKYPQPIKENMTIAMETWAGQNDSEKGWRGGCRLENIWRITKNGHENLYAMPDTDIICPPHAIYVW